jgi:membrane associated rhomboid family serine protease
MTEESAGGLGSAAPPTCYRHPDRESHIRCARCGRPICPDCMVSAPVGFQCPECVNEARATSRRPRTLSGAAIHGDAALVTKVLVAVNVVVYLLDEALNHRLFTTFEMQGAAVAVNGDWYRLVTSAFLHVGFTHLALNMVALWFVGAAVEARLGRWRYLTVYLLSALGGSVLSYAVDSPFQASVGASGAVFGVFGALFVLSVKLRFDLGGLIALIVINAVIGFVPGLNINWRAHLGGLIVGSLLTAVMIYAPQRTRAIWSLGASVLIFVVLAGVTVTRTHEINACTGDSPQGATYDRACMEDLVRIGEL